MTKDMNASTSLTPVPTSQVSIEQEMRNSYRDYALSVIISRALPDVRDGLKPVHRRILYAMHESGYKSNKAYRKSARIVGDIMGKYHPHGDSAIYDAMVRLAQTFSMSTLLIDGQGNFGSIDGDPPAAMRYTESRLTHIVDEALVKDIEYDTVNFRPNYDNSESEPTVLPAAFPNLLVNGVEGIAVGMATKIPPHNITEVINATLAWMDNPAITVDEIMEIIPGPDFPTAGTIMGKAAIREAYLTGRGSIPITSTWKIEEHKGGRESLVFTELPYQVNKKELEIKIKALVRAKGDPKATKYIEGISDMRDESDREGIRLVIEIRKDSTPENVLAQLRKHTRIETTFPVNLMCISSAGKPELMGLLRVLEEFVNFRREVIARRTRFLLNKAREELLKAAGLYAARTQIEKVVSIVRSARDNDEARAGLMGMEFSTTGELGEILNDIDPDVPLSPVFRLSQDQANEVLNMRLSRLTKLNIDKIVEDVRGLIRLVRGYIVILNKPEDLDNIVRNELVALRDKFPQKRRTRIEANGPSEITDDETIIDRQVVLTLTRSGYVKITPLDSYREQNRGGKGKSGMETKDDDVVSKTMICSTRTHLIFFTTRGIAHVLRANDIQIVAPNSKGRPIVNYIGALRSGETIATVMAQPSDHDDGYIAFVTDTGSVRLNNASDFKSVNRGGKIAMKLEDDNGLPTARLIDVLTCTKGDDLVLATRSGKIVRFDIVEEVRVMASRSSTGVTGVKLAKDDEVISASILKHFDATAQERDAYFSGGTHTWKDEQGQEQQLVLSDERMQSMKDSEQFLLTVASRGYGKRFSSLDFRTTGRGTQGVSGGTFSETTGNLVACFPVVSDDSLVIIANSGQTIRIGIKDIRVMGRATRGVRLFALDEDQTIVDIARVSGEVLDEISPTALLPIE